MVSTNTLPLQRKRKIDAGCLNEKKSTSISRQTDIPSSYISG